MTEGRKGELNNTVDAHPPHERVLALIEKAILFSRWLQVPMLLGLILAFIMLGFAFVRHLFSLVLDGDPLSRTNVILITLDLIDMVLIANLVVMVLISGYKIFVSPLQSADDSKVPRWLRSATPGQLKLRIATTVLLISTIHLLHFFLDPARSADRDVALILMAQGVFALTTLVFVVVERFESREP